MSKYADVKITRKEYMALTVEKKQLVGMLTMNIESLNEFEIGLKLLKHDTLAEACNVIVLANKQVLKDVGEEV